MAPVLKPSEDVATAVSNWISDNDVMVFSKSTCPFCLKVKQMFKAKRIDFAVVELDTMGQPGIDIQTELVNKTGQKTVPNVFIRGKHIGT
jgi:glutaredoxin